jgi:hypothetical protein
MTKAEAMPLIALLSVLPILAFAGMAESVGSWTVLCLFSVVIIAYSIRAMLSSGGTA